jgi:RNA polymerase sigma factor (sigma-70 family)
MGAQSEPLPDHYQRIWRFVRSRVRTTEDADDLTQEVFANAASALNDESSSPTLAWLYTVAKRRIVDEARRRGRLDTTSLEVVDDPRAPEAEYGQAVARVLDAALSSMPEGQRRIVVGRLIQGRRFADLSRELETTEEACRMRFMRGLEHLRDEFTKEGLAP